jgi:hypothetical protein
LGGCRGARASRSRLAAGAADPRFVRRRLQAGAGTKAGISAIDRGIEQFCKRGPDRLHFGPMRLRFRDLGFRNPGFRRFAGSFREIGSLRHVGNMGRVRPAGKGAVSRMRADAMVTFSATMKQPPPFAGSPGTDNRRLQRASAAARFLRRTSTNLRGRNRIPFHTRNRRGGGQSAVRSDGS